MAIKLMKPGEDMFSVGASALVNPVNCLGVMGKGLSKEFKKRFPASSADYIWLARDGHVRLGSVLRCVEPGPPRTVIYQFPTKRHWSDRSYIGDVLTGLEDLKKLLRFDLPDSVAIPALGCGLGGLPWKDVLCAMQKYLDEVPVHIMVFPPHEPEKPQ